MSKTKNIIVLASASIILIAIVVSTIFFFIDLTSPENDELFLSEKETITINIENKDIGYFEDIDFINKEIDIVKENFKNVVQINDEKILMKNVKWNNINGDLQLMITEKKITNLLFSSNFASANDVYTSFLSLNTNFAKNNGLKEEKVQLCDGNSTKDIGSVEELFVETNYLIVSYNIDGKVFTIKTNFSNNVYTMTATFNY